MKQYIIVRTDKKFSIGKIMAHVGHNCLSCYVDRKNEIMTDDDRWNSWYFVDNQTKIVVKTHYEQIKSIIDLANIDDIPTSFIEDVHLKEQICAVVGPVSDREATYLGLFDLKLYR